MRGWLPALLLVVSITASGAEEEIEKGKQLFEAICAACHSLALPRSQHLDRNNWNWVLDDMINVFGCGISEEQRALILEYLVAEHGREE